jgi:hypothetical protein
MANSRMRGGLQQVPGKAGGIANPPTPTPVPGQEQAPAQSQAPVEQDDNESLIQGLTPGQMQVLAIKVYDLLLDEIRLEAERTGRRNIR